MAVFNHKSVMLGECIENLDIKPDGIYVDGTLGGGGHSLEIVKRLTGNGRLIAIDKDEEALMYASGVLKEYKSKITFVHDDYKNMPEILDSLGIESIDGILLDLGVSSYQLDNRERGFSYNGDADLDMRMDRTQYLTAFNVVNEYNESELARVIWEYGEERYSRQIARNICRIRETESIATTMQLAKIVEASIPAANRWKGGNPSKRTFQAIRIEVNGELRGLGDALEKMTLRLKKGGRICVITFHSLEDRIAKTVFKELERSCVCPPGQPICTCNKRQEVKLINKKPLVAQEEELENNSRAQSAKLRVAERI